MERFPSLKDWSDLVMFVYIDYENYKKKYHDTQNKFDEILKEKEVLFSKTQPKSAKWDKVGTPGLGHCYNPFDEYLIAKDKKRIDDRLFEIKSILEDRAMLLRAKEQELRSSKNNIDQIYRMRFLDQMHITKIAIIVHYSESQVYRILKNIKQTI